jgi:hypothetical protein
MYAGKSAAKLEEEKLKKKKMAARAEVEKNVSLVTPKRYRSKQATRTSKPTSTNSPSATKTR